MASGAELGAYCLEFLFSLCTEVWDVLRTWVLRLEAYSRCQWDFAAPPHQAGQPFNNGSTEGMEPWRSEDSRIPGTP